MLEQFNKTINIEGQLMILMANRYILPAAFEYQRQVGSSVAAVKSAGGPEYRPAVSSAHNMSPGSLASTALSRLIWEALRPM